MDAVAELGEALVNDLQQDLELELDRLGVEGEELRARVKELAAVMSTTAIMALAGKDVTVARTAIKSSVQSLKAAGAITAVESVKTLLAGAASRAFSLAITLI